jgi:hypothetical protein
MRPMPVSDLSPREPQLSVSTLIEASALWGDPFQDRSFIREAQDEGLLRELEASSSQTLPARVGCGRPAFFYGSIDCLVTRAPDGPRFHFIEMNGTNMAGVTNAPWFVVDRVLAELRAAARMIPWDGGPAPVVLVPFSGKKGLGTAGLIYERLLYGQAIKEGLAARHGRARIVTHAEITSETFAPTEPTVVLGYLKELMPRLARREGGGLSFCGAPVAGGHHDTFLDQIRQLLGSDVLGENFFSLNGIYPLTADKGVAYGAYNALLAETAGTPAAFRYFRDPIRFDHARTEDELVALLVRRLGAREKLVIKPHAAGLGRGVEFFLAPESEDVLRARVRESVGATERHYSAADSGYPYSVATFVDADVIRDPAHPQYGHKFELRVFVYRDGDRIRACPTIAKVASLAYDPAHPTRLSLLNNVAASMATRDDSPRVARDYVLPLCNLATLRTLGLEPDHLAEVCRLATAYAARACEYAVAR